MRVFDRIVFFLLCFAGVWWIEEPIFSGEYALFVSFD